MSNKLAKHAFWQNHIEQFKASGLSQQAYCAQHRLKVHQLGYWLRKFPSGEQNKESSSGFVAIPIAGRHSEGLCISLPSGVRVSGFGAVSDVAQLLKLLA